MDNVIASLGIEEQSMTLLSRIFMLCVLIGIGSILDMFARKVLINVIRFWTARTETKWDDYLLNRIVLHRLCHLIIPLLLYFFLPVVLDGYSTILFYTQKIVALTIVVLIVKLGCSLLDGLHRASEEEIGLKNHPLDGLAQMLKLIVVALGVIVAISLLLDKNPSAILAGLGASAAVLMLIFKDTILGFVAGIQLSVNKMLRVGDWITIPSRNVNGLVEEVSLTTVKVRNYDNTILTVPPYALVSESFQNWRGMQDRGGRRVMRSINIDMNTVRFSTPAEMERFESLGLLKGWVSSEETPVNLKIFRNYLENYIGNHPGIVVNTEEKMLLMVRQLQPTPQGLPIELYFFSASVDWVEYERLQADIFDHLIAVVKEFGLKIYQAPSGDDMLNIFSTHQLKQL